MRHLLGTAVLAAAWCAAAPGQDAQSPPAPLKVHVLSGSKEYKSDEFVKVLTAHLARHYGAKVTASLAKDGGAELPDLDALDGADVMLVFCRRLKITGEPLERIRKWCQAGRPVVGVRTASHAFQNWLEFDKEVLGGDYRGHGGNEPAVEARVEPKAREHPVLAGIETWKRPGKLYKNPAIAADATLLITGVGAKDTPPVAWARTQTNGGRVFYTSMGVPTDFQNETFLRLMANALYWTAKRPVPADKAPATQPKAQDAG